MRIALITFLAIPLTLFAKETPKYPIAAIPEELKKGANAVFREDALVFEIVAQDKAITKIHQVITILNANAKRYATEVIGYGKNSKVTILKGIVYDATGEVVKKIKQSEVYDQSAYDGFSLYSDNRLKVLDLTHGSYPYTIEFEYEIEYKFLFFIPTFVAGGEKVAVENARYTLLFPTKLRPFYKTSNVAQTPIEQSLGNGKESISWEFKKIIPFVFEPLGPDAKEVLPHISAAPSKFNYDGYAGTMDSWEEFGKWIVSLNQNRNELPSSVQEKINELTQSCKTTEEKVKRIYEYMQSRTRYVSIQLGIGGFQPFEASVVNETGYGDCKALSNYMVSMLEMAGIPANYVLIRAGDGESPIDVSFPSTQFNHVVVLVPMQKDTLWLECTSQTNPFGYMGSFTGNRKALAITDKGGVIVSTPTYLENENVLIRKAEVALDEYGNAKAQIKTAYSGLEYETENLNFILGNQYDEQKKWIQQTTDIPSFDVTSYKLLNTKDKIPTATVEMNLTLNRLASVSGKRVFLTPNLMNKSRYIPEKQESRTTDVVLHKAFTHIDSVHYILPDNLYPEFVPPPIKVSSPYGEYEAHFILNEKGLTYTRKFLRKKGRFDAKAYDEVGAFFRTINKADNTKIVFLNKT